MKINLDIPDAVVPAILNVLIELKTAKHLAAASAKGYCRWPETAARLADEARALEAVVGQITRAGGVAPLPAGRAETVQIEDGRLTVQVRRFVSGYANNLGALRTAGLVEYPVSGSVRLTDAGRSAAQAPAHPPTTEDLHATLKARLSAPQWRILEELIRVHPDDVGRGELADRAGQSATSSGYANNLGALRSLGFIDYPRSGHVIAQPVLFLER